MGQPLSTSTKETSTSSLQSHIKDYFEAGHDKKAPDGVCGVLKRSVDGDIKHGENTPDAQTLWNKTEMFLLFSGVIIIKLLL